MSAAAAAPALAKARAVLQVLLHLVGPRCSRRSFAPLQPVLGQGTSHTRLEVNAKALPGRGLVGKAAYTSMVRPSKIVRGAQGGSSTHQAARRGVLSVPARAVTRDAGSLGKGRRAAGSPLAL